MDAGGLGTDSSRRLATALGVWGLFGLVRRREGEPIALAAVIAFSLFPITLRYGRAFQPDALMLGRCWRAWIAGIAPSRGAAAGGWLPAWLLLAWAWPPRSRRPWSWSLWPRDPEAAGTSARMLLAASALVPVLLWYAWADHLVDSGAGSRASAENRAIWLAVFGVSALGEPRDAGAHRSLPARPGLHPTGADPGRLGACLGRSTRGARSGAWSTLESLGPGRCWSMMALLAEKLHHEYYWLSLAPVVAAGLGRGLVETRRSGIAGLPGSSAGVFSPRVRSWHARPGRPPRNGRTSRRRPTRSGGRSRRGLAGGREPLLYQADRRGCRLEFTPQAAAGPRRSGPGERAQDDRGTARPDRLLSQRRAPDSWPTSCPRPAMTGERPCIRRSADVTRFWWITQRVIIAELNPPENPGHGQ